MADSTSFYGAAAGAIPLLYIALAVEERAGTFIEDLVSIFVDEEDRPVAVAVVRGAYLLVVASVLLSGVAAAFVGLAHPRWDLNFHVGYTAYFVAAALIFGGGLLVVQPFLSIVLSVVKRMQLSRSASALAVGAGLAGALIVVYFVGFLIWALVH